MKTPSEKQYLRQTHLTPLSAESFYSKVKIEALELQLVSASRADGVGFSVHSLGL
jgi:hypothetical protein